MAAPIYCQVIATVPYLVSQVLLLSLYNLVSTHNQRDCQENPVSEENPGRVGWEAVRG